MRAVHHAAASMTAHAQGTGLFPHSIGASGRKVAIACTARLPEAGERAGGCASPSAGKTPVQFMLPAERLQRLRQRPFALLLCGENPHFKQGQSHFCLRKICYCGFEFVHMVTSGQTNNSALLYFIDVPYVRMGCLVIMPTKTGGCAHCSGLV